MPSATWRHQCLLRDPSTYESLSEMARCQAVSRAWMTIGWHHVYAARSPRLHPFAPASACRGSLLRRHQTTRPCRLCLSRTFPNLPQMFLQTGLGRASTRHLSQPPVGGDWGLPRYSRRPHRPISRNFSERFSKIQVNHTRWAACEAHHQDFSSVPLPHFRSRPRMSRSMFAGESWLPRCP